MKNFLSWLPYPLYDSTQSSPDSSCRNVVTRAAMQYLDNQIWKSKISISTKLKLYNPCILPNFLYGSDCWAVTKRYVHKVDALDHWCLWMMLHVGIKWYHHARNDGVIRTTNQPHLSAIGQAGCFTLSQYSATLRECQMKQMPPIRSYQLFHGELQETTRTPLYYINEDYAARAEV